MPRDPKIARDSADPFGTNHGKLAVTDRQIGRKVKLQDDQDTPEAQTSRRTAGNRTV